MNVFSGNDGTSGHAQVEFDIWYDDEADFYMDIDMGILDIHLDLLEAAATHLRSYRIFLYFSA